jgi:hypothetical protein
MYRKILERPANLTEFDRLQTIRIAAEVNYSFLLHWVRRAGVHDVAGDLGLRLRSPRPANLNITINGNFRLLKSIHPSGRMRLRVYRLTSLEGRTVSVTAVAPLPGESDADPLLSAVLQRPGVRDAIYGLAAESLRKEHTILFSRMHDQEERGEPLIDASFADTESGLECWMAAAQGDFTSVFSGSLDIELHHSTFDSFSGYSSIELFLPHLDRKDWKSPADAIDRAPVRCNEAGQIFVGWQEESAIEDTLRLAGFVAAHKTRSAGSFTINHTGEADEYGTRITRRIPGGYFTTWFDAPGDRDPAYGPTYGEIALSVQRVLREELPRLWFSNPDRYAKLQDSHAMLVYQCSRPFVGKTRTEFSYEFQSPTSMRRFYKTAALALPEELARVHDRFFETAHAAHYHPNSARQIVQAVEKQRRFIDRLMAAESTIIECFIQFGVAGKEVRERITSRPADAAEQITKYAEAFSRALNYRVKRIHPTLDCSDLALPLLIEASSSLSGMMRGRSGVTTLLHIQTPNAPVRVHAKYPDKYPFSAHYSTGRQIS